RREPDVRRPCRLSFRRRSVLFEQLHADGEGAGRPDPYGRLSSRTGQSNSQPRSPWLVISSPSRSSFSLTRIGNSNDAASASRTVATTDQAATAATPTN